MDIKTQNKWDSIYSDSRIGESHVSHVLDANVHLLPASGKALDLACGKGGDAIFLAKHGLQVDAWDISNNVIDKLNQYAESEKLSLHATVHDANVSAISENTYDVICVAHYLVRDLSDVLIAALKPGGLLFYQTFTQLVTDTYSGPGNPNFRLAENELLSLFSVLKVVVYREEALLGDVNVGFRNEAMLVARKE